MSIAIVDSYAWIEFLIGGPKASSVREVLLESDTIATPDVVLAELARKLHREGFTIEHVRESLLEITGLSEIVSIDLEIARNVHAADIDLRANARKHRLDRSGLSDALILATARTLGGRVLTGDPHFEGLPETIWLA